MMYVKGYNGLFWWNENEGDDPKIYLNNPIYKTKNDSW